MALCGSPWPNRSRNTSRIFRIDNLSPGIPNSLLHGKGPRLPSVEDCQRQRPRLRLPALIMITGTDDHDPPEIMITINWIT
jgi:hypothetical protein